MAHKKYRSALVTGATSGIGEAFVSALTSSDLVLTGRNEDKLLALAQQVERPGRRVDIIGADLTTEPGMDAVIEAADAAKIDLLICNAGVGQYGDFLNIAELDIRQTLALNVVAPAILVRRLLPGMLARSAGTRAGLIVLSSGAAFIPVPRMATYAATKAFDLSLTEALTAELAHEPIDILALCPTATRTSFATRSGWRGALPGGQSPAHVASAALRAMGRRSTLTLGPISSNLLNGPALSRHILARAMAKLLPRGH